MPLRDDVPYARYYCEHALSHLILLRDKQQPYESDTGVIPHFTYVETEAQEEQVTFDVTQLHSSRMRFLILVCVNSESNSLPTRPMIANFSVKGQVVNILRFTDHMVSVKATQLCYHSAKAARDSVNKQAWLYSNKTLFKRTAVGQL